MYVLFDAKLNETFQVAITLTGRANNSAIAAAFATPENDHAHAVRQIFAFSAVFLPGSAKKGLR